MTARVCKLVFATVSDPLLRTALWLGIASLVLSVAMLAAVLFLRFGNLTRTRQSREFGERWQRVLLQCLEEPQRPPPLPVAHAYIFLKLWNRMHESLRGEANDKLNALARSLGADRIARAYLASGDARKELIAILTLGNLREPSVRGAIEKLLYHRSPVVSLRSAQALLRIDPGALPQVLATAARRADWPIPRMISLLRELSPEAVSPILQRTIAASLELPYAVQRVPRLLKLIDAAHAEQVRPAVLRALKLLPEAETIAAGVAALRHPDDVALVRGYASHPEWHVRLEAANALGRLGTRQDLHRLVAMLGDPSWWVRHRAAQAVAALPWAATGQLERLAAALQDRFAADALRQAIAERRLP